MFVIMLTAVKICGACKVCKIGKGCKYIKTSSIDHYYKIVAVVCDCIINGGIHQTINPTLTHYTPHHTQMWIVILSFEK